MGSFLFDVNGSKITRLIINKPVTNPVMIEDLLGSPGIVGWADSIKIISSYWDKETTGLSRSVGGNGQVN